MPKEKKNLKVETITLEQVPESEKKSWASIAFIWAGNVICVPALMVGGMITAGLNFRDSVIAMLIGYAITVFLMMLTAAQAARTGVPSTVAVGRALGEKGSRFTISLVLAFSMIGWYGYQTIVCASSFCNLMLNSFGISFPQWIACVIGVIPAGVGALICGSILAICANDTDITIMFANIGLPVLGMLILILATWSTNVGNAYSAGIAVVNALKLRDDRRAIVTAGCGIVGILISLGGIVYYFVDFLSLLSYLITPIAALLVADYWLMGKGKTEEWKPFPGINWIGVISWIIGTLVTYFDTFFIPEIIGIAVTMCVYCVLCRVVKSPAHNPFAKEDKK